MSKNPKPVTGEAGQPSPYSVDHHEDPESAINPVETTIEAGAIAVFAVYAGQFRAALEADEAAGSTRTAERLAKLSVKLAKVLAVEIAVGASK